MWKVAIEDDQANQTVVDLVRDEYTIGRDVANTVRLTERNISRKHAVLSKHGSEWHVRDLDSYNGCFVNGARISGEYTLKHGDLLQLGDYRVELMDDAIVANADSDTKSSTLPGRPSQTIRDLPNRLVMIAGPTIGASFPLVDKRVVIGRGEDCDLPINDTSVSRVHAEIHALEGGRYEVVDKDSSNGVRVNGVELNRTILDASDVIELGDVQLKFVPAGQVFHPQDLGARGNSLEPGIAESDPQAARTRVLAIVAAIAILGVILVIALRGAEPTVASSSETNASATLLDEAKALLDRGDVEAARKKTQELPEDSNLRESATFKEVQTRWAESVLERAAAEQDRARRRYLLDLVAKSPDVGSMLRKRAAGEIAVLDTDTVGIDELPSAAKAPAADAPTAAALPSPAPAPPPKRKTEVKGGLVRDTPF